MDFLTLRHRYGISRDLTPASTLDAPDEFSISELYWNASAVVSGLALTTATHSVEGDVFAGWTPVLTSQTADGFGTFDFGLVDGVGAGNPNVIGVGESVTFLLTISGTCAGTTTCPIPSQWALDQADDLPLLRSRSSHEASPSP